MSQVRVHLVATGGTIAGVADDPATTTRYLAGSLAGHALLESIPEAHHAASISISQPFNLDSKDFGPGHWLQLAREVTELIGEPTVDAIVVTHGTDTLEETAFLLDRLIPPGKPVVLTCAMRPASAHSADGPLNLLHAIQVAASGVTCEAGVVAVINERIHSGSWLRKAHTHAISAFDLSGSAIGWAHPPALVGARAAPRRQPELLACLDELPRVDVLWVGAGAEPDLLAASVAHGARAVVLCLPGNGSLPIAWHDAVDRATSRGIVVVRASRTGEGRVVDDADDDHRHRFAAGQLSPAQSRVALMLALAAGLPPHHFFA